MAVAYRNLDRDMAVFQWILDWWVVGWRNLDWRATDWDIEWYLDW